VRIFWLIVVFISCDNFNEYASINSSDDDLDLSSRYVKYDGTLFSGVVYKLYPNQRDTLAISFYKKGLKEGFWKKFYQNGALLELREYKKDKKKGLYKGYYLNGSKAFELVFKNGEYHGTNREWSEKGRLIREANYIKGYEKGSQKVWSSDGKIKSNYIIKDNRRYGLLGTKNCINVSEDIFAI
jgi:antitoxin component YwqK of YwqJK toxin-antitoxin module